MVGHGISLSRVFCGILANMKKFLLLILVTATAGWAQKFASTPEQGRSMVVTKYGIVAAPQFLASQAGVQILQAGGNAVDAAIAANAVMGVTQPYVNGMGGDLFALLLRGENGQVVRFEFEWVDAEGAHA